MMRENPVPAARFAMLVAAAAIVGVFAFPTALPQSAQAFYEDIYTMPFYSSHDITCPWGPYGNCGLSGGNHNGTDYSLGRNTTDNEVVASAVGGTAWLFRDYDPVTGLGCGEYIVVDDPAGHKSRYCHLKDRIVGDGQQVARGEVIGHEGTTGATGIHLHFDSREGGTAGNCCNGTSVDPYGGPYSPGTWMWQDQPPGGQPPSHADFSPAVASWTSSRVDVFVRGKDDKTLYQRTRTGSTWGGWTQPVSGSCLRSGPAASTWSTTRLDVFVRGCDNAVWHNWWTGGGSWYGGSLGGCAMSAPAAASWGTNRIGLFVRGCDNVLYKNLYTGSWSGWTAVSGACLRSGPGAVSWGTNRFDVVYRGCDDAIMHLWSIDGGQSFSSESFGECTMLAPSIASWGSAKLDVFMRGCGPAGAGEGIYWKSYNGSSWSGWTSLGGCLASGVGTDAWAPDWLDVFVRGCDSPPNVYTNYWNGSSWPGYSIFSSWP